MAKQLFANNATTTIVSTILATDLTITLYPGTGSLFPAPIDGDWFLVTLYDTISTVEIVKVTARTGDVLTVVRGQEGTIASAFPSGSIVEARATRDTYENFVQRYELDLLPTGIQDAPIDNSIYGRQNASWVKVAAAGGDTGVYTLPSSGFLYIDGPGSGFTSHGRTQYASLTGTAYIHRITMAEGEFIDFYYRTNTSNLSLSSSSLVTWLNDPPATSTNKFPKTTDMRLIRFTKIGTTIFGMYLIPGPFSVSNTWAQPQTVNQGLIEKSATLTPSAGILDLVCTNGTLLSTTLSTPTTIRTSNLLSGQSCLLNLGLLSGGSVTWEFETGNTYWVGTTPDLYSGATHIIAVWKSGLDVYRKYCGVVV